MARPLEHTSNLALDVDDAMCLCLRTLKHLPSFARQQPHRSIPLFQEFLGTVIQDEPRALLVRFEPKFLGDEADLYVRFVPGAPSTSAFTSNKRR